MVAAATSRQDLPPKTPAQRSPAKNARANLPAEAQSPLHRSEERKGEGRRVVSRLAGARCEAAERGWGAEQKGGRDLPKSGRGQREVRRFVVCSRKFVVCSSRFVVCSSFCRRVSGACRRVSGACRRLSGLRLVTWTPLLVIFSLARSGYTCQGARHEPSDHAGERLGGERQQGTTTRSGKSQLPLHFLWGLCKCLWEAPVSVK